MPESVDYTNMACIFLVEIAADTEKAIFSQGHIVDVGTECVKVSVDNEVLEVGKDRVLVNMIDFFQKVSFFEH